jgi:CRP/FNR family transcriptional regulator, cyclic AMP receptor protein
MATALVRIFEQDPELLAGLSRREAAKAASAAVAKVIPLERGEWRPPLLRLGPGDLGFLVLDGLIVRRTEVAGRTGVELLGPGDIARPWSADFDPLVPAALSVHVSERTTVAILDRGFVETVSRWPEILAQILERFSTRTASLSFQLAIAWIPTLEQRLLVTSASRIVVIKVLADGVKAAVSERWTS